MITKQYFYAKLSNFNIYCQFNGEMIIFTGLSFDQKVQFSAHYYQEDLPPEILKAFGSISQLYDHFNDCREQSIQILGDNLHIIKDKQNTQNKFSLPIKIKSNHSYFSQPFYQYQSSQINSHQKNKSGRINQPGKIVKNYSPQKSIKSFYDSSQKEPINKVQPQTPSQAPFRISRYITPITKKDSSISNISNYFKQQESIQKDSYDTQQLEKVLAKKKQPIPMRFEIDYENVNKKWFQIVGNSIQSEYKNLMQLNGRNGILRNRNYLYEFKVVSLQAQQSQFVLGVITGQNKINKSCFGHNGCIGFKFQSKVLAVEGRKKYYQKDLLNINDMIGMQVNTIDMNLSFFVNKDLIANTTIPQNMQEYLLFPYFEIEGLSSTLKII